MYSCDREHESCLFLTSNRTDQVQKNAPGHITAAQLGKLPSYSYGLTRQEDFTLLFLAAQHPAAVLNNQATGGRLVWGQMPPRLPPEPLTPATPCRCAVWLPFGLRCVTQTFFPPSRLAPGTKVPRGEE